MFPERKAFSTVTWIVWDELGNFVGIGYPDDAGVADPVRSVSLSYSQGYLTGIPGFMTSQSYHANGMVAQRVLANGVREEYGLNADAMARWGRMRVFSPANQQLWDSGSYEYDGAGNIKAMVRSVADKDSYSYDLVSRLVLANFKAGGNAKQAQFTYDEAGNLKGETTTDYGTRQFAVDASRNRISGCGYDGAGRVTSCGGLSFSWSALGELFGVQGTGINRSFLYTADGERIAVRNHLGGTVAVWLRELGGNPLRVYLRTSTGSWSWSRDDVWVGREQVASVYASGVQYVHSDHLGSPRKVTDSLGNVVASNDFYPFGLPAATTGLQGSWFSGYELEHQNTSSTYTDDLYFLHARWYFPQVARFLSPDPVRGNLSSPQSFNLFAYVGGNPINFLDPWGLAAREVAGAGSNNRERDGYCSGDDGEDPDCPRFSEEVTVTANAIWPGGRLGVGVPGVWIASVEMYIDRYVASDTFFGEPRMTSDVTIGLLAPRVRGNAWVSSNSAQSLAVLQGIAATTQPLLSYWESVFETELFWLAGGPADEGLAWLFSRESPVFGLGCGLSTGNQWLRVGWGRKGGYYSFRLSGRVIDWLKGYERAHIDLWTGPRIQ